MRNTFNISRSFLAKLLIRFGVMSPFVWLCARAIRANGKLGNGEITALALNISRFRGDLECLAETGRFTIRKVPFHWQARVFLWFYRSGDDCFKVNDPIIIQRQARLRSFLRSFLAQLYKELGVDLVLSAGIHYRQDFDWGAVSHELGVPYVVLHREGNVASASTQDAYRLRGHEWGRFHGTMLVLQNEVQRNVLIESGYIDESNSIAAGIMRMDQLFDSRVAPVPPRQRQRVTFFGFGPSTGVLSGKPPSWPNEPRNFLYDLTRMTHVTLLRLAAERPDIDVVIKPKWGGRWIEAMDKMLAADGMDCAAYSNVAVDTEAHVHSLMRSSDVIIAFNSTTLLEAAILGLPVIIPVFAEIVEPRWQDHLMYADELKCFDVAHSAEELRELILRRLKFPAIDPAVMVARRRAFVRYVSGIDGRATERYRDILVGQVERSRSGTTSAPAFSKREEEQRAV